MSETNLPLLLVGEVFLDFKARSNSEDAKLRLGGIVHAARALWAAGIDYAAAVVCPSNMYQQAEDYLLKHGCRRVYWLADVVGSPNVIIYDDPTEVDQQGYDTLLRDEKSVSFFEPDPVVRIHKEVLIFPGGFEMAAIANLLHPEARVSMDVAYDVMSLEDLQIFAGRIELVAISTSSVLFQAEASSELTPFLKFVAHLNPKIFLLKENRGGSRVFELQANYVEEIPAILTNTVNSVGVGDAYSAVMVGFRHLGWIEAAWRGSQVATIYSQTTYPDDLQRDVRRSLTLSVEQLRTLGGTRLPWHERSTFPIYMAGPDFSYVHKPEFDRALESLRYHNFNVRLPVRENGELKRPASKEDLVKTFGLDYQLIRECSAMFAVPLERDPGTLVEIGIAIALGKPVITFDPRMQNENTMVTEGSSTYSSDLDLCLNGLFATISKLRSNK